jgi:hypothetical protein
MGHWITVGDDDQHVYVTDSGKIAATRSAISSAGGAKERGKALAARSKAAIGKAMSRSGAVERARSRIENSEIAENFTPELKQAHAGLKALPAGTKVVTREGKKGEIVKEWRKPTTLNERSKQENQVRLEGEKTAKFIHPNHVEPIDEKLSWRARSQQSPATTRAIDHARAAGPSLREQADKARAGKGAYDTRVKKIIGDLRTRAVAHQKASQDPTKPDRVILSEDVKYKRVVGRARKFAAGLKAKGHPAAK